MPSSPGSCSESPCRTIPPYMTLSVPSQASIAIIRYTFTLLGFKFPFLGQISLSGSVISMFILPAMFPSNSYRERGREKWRSPNPSVDYGALIYLGADGLWLPVSAMALSLFLVSYSWREEYKLKHVFSKKIRICWIKYNNVFWRETKASWINMLCCIEYNDTWAEIKRMGEKLGR